MIANVGRHELEILFGRRKYILGSKYLCLECVDGGYEMATFLGYKIGIDEEDEWEDYYVDDRY